MPDPTIKTSTQPTSYPTDRTARLIMCTYLRAMGSLNLINYMPDTGTQHPLTSQSTKKSNSHSVAQIIGNNHRASIRHNISGTALLGSFKDSASDNLNILL